MIHLFFSASESRQDPTIQYLTGHAPGFGLCAYDPATKKKCLFVADFEVKNYKAIRVFPFHTKSLKKNLCSFFSIKLSRTNKKVPKIKSTKKLQFGYHKQYLTVSGLQFFKKNLSGKYTDVSTIYRKLRMIKNHDEQAHVTQACAIADIIYGEVVAYLTKQISLQKKVLLTERDIVKFMRQRMIFYDVTESFTPIVAASKNAALPHYHSGTSVLSGFVLIDFGVIYHGYCSDMTRMLYLGKPSKQELFDFNCVLSLVKKSEKLVAIGKKCADTDAYVRKELKTLFIHSLGHGVGLEVHEAPALSPSSPDLYADKMTFTLEPGLYRPNKYGIRLENTYLLTKKGLTSLTKQPLDLVIL